jgi:flagellar basal-body rod protein FlgC
MADMLFSVMRSIGSGLTAQRKKMESIASNIANAETTRTEDGLPYRKQTVVIEGKKIARRTRVKSQQPSLRLQTTSPFHIAGASAPSERVTVTEEPVMEARVVEAPPGRVRVVYDPQHPDANDEGYVEYPAINPVEEMVDMLSATRAYEANITAMEAFKSMVEKALEI